MTAPLARIQIGPTSRAARLPDSFDAFTLENVRAAAPDLTEANANRPFIEGDHLQGGDAWVGPGPRAGSGGFDDFFRLLEVVFTSSNVIDEGCDRLVSAIAGRESRWAWVPRRRVTKDEAITDAEREAIAEIEDALTEWWDSRQVHTALKRMIYRAQWAARACYRLNVPAGLTGTDGSLNVSGLAEALDKIYVDIPEPEDAFVYENPNTKQRLGVVFYRDALNREACEVCYTAAGETVIRILPAAASTVDRAGNDFGGRLPVFQIQLDQPLITAQVRSLQRQLNMALTLLGKNQHDNQFLERLFVDVLAPGHWEMEPDGMGGTRRKAYVVDEGGRRTGGRTDSYLQSVDFQDEAGKTQLAKGSITIRDPLDPEGAIKGASFWYQKLLEELRQDHILINQSATPSGKSRDEARGDFADSGKDSQTQLEIAGRELLLTVLSMAEAFIGTPGRWTNEFRPVFKCNARYGKLSTEERKQNVAEAKEGFLSDETAMALNDVEDVDAEKNLIQGQPRAMLKLSGDRADTVNKWGDLFPREVALYMAGLEDDEIKEIMKRVGLAESDDPSAPPIEPAPIVPAPPGAPKPAVRQPPPPPLPARG